MKYLADRFFMRAAGHPGHSGCPGRCAASVAGVLVMLAIAAIALPPAAAAQDEAEDASDASDASLATRVHQAYQQLDTYEATIRYSVVHKHGRWNHRRWTDMRVALDRDGNRLRLEHPEFTMVVDESEVRVRLSLEGTEYLVEQPITGGTGGDGKLTYEALLGAWPVLEQVMAPDLVLLLADEPWPVIGDASVGRPRETVIDDQPAIVLTGMAGVAGGSEARLQVDPETLLISRAERDRAEEESGDLSADHEHVDRYEITIDRRNEPLPDELFQLDAGQAKPIELSELMGGGRPPHPLKGEPIPDVTFHDAQGGTFDPAKADAEVVILDFWASWCMPCRTWMPELEQIHQWAQRNDKSVAIYGVTVEDQLEKSREYWDGQSFSFHYTEARDPDAVNAVYGRPMQGGYGRTIPLPTTMVLHEGRIVDVREGVAPGEQRRLRELIDRLLRDGGAAREAAD